MCEASLHPHSFPPCIPNPFPPFPLSHVVHTLTGGGESWRCISCDSKAAVPGNPGVSVSNPGTDSTHTPRASVPRVTRTGVSTHLQPRQSIGSRQGGRAQTSPSAAASLPSAGGPSPASEWFKAGEGEFNDAGEAPVVRPATGQQSARNQMPRQSSPPQSGIVTGSRMAGFSSNHSLPPQTFHKDKRDLVGEQLAELERREGWAEGGVAALMLHMPLAGEGGLGQIGLYSHSMPCSPSGLGQQHIGAGNGSSSARQAANQQAAANASRAPPSRGLQGGRQNVRSSVMSGGRSNSGMVDPMLSLVPVPADQYHHIPESQGQSSGGGGAGLPSIAAMAGKPPAGGGLTGRTSVVR